MVRYSLGINGVFDNERNCFIPNDPDNRDYAEYQRWLDAGNTPQPADTAP